MRGLASRYEAAVLWFRNVFAIALMILIGGPRSASRMAIYPEHLTIRSTPVTIESGNPARIRVGAMTLVAGWQLTSESPQFGGWSALDVVPDTSGQRVTAISDSGSVLRFHLGRFGHALGARIDPLPTGCGPNTNKYDRDSESLARMTGGDWLVGFEWHNSLCRITPDFAHAVRLREPPEMADWPKTRGPESLLRLSDGRYVVLEEGDPDDGQLRSLLIFADDPTLADAHPVKRQYVAPVGMSPTDATQLPDGRILLINRRFSLFTLFTTSVVSVDPAALDRPEPIHATVLAKFAPPLLSDNYEGLAVTVEGGRPYVWMISDDNFMSWQGTYLLKFAIDPEPDR